MIRLRSSAILLFLLAMIGCSGLAVAGELNDSTVIIHELQQLEQRFGGHLGLAAKNMLTGEVVRFRADERFPTASAIKFPVMAAFFDRVRQHAIDPSTRITLSAEDQKPGSGILQYLTPGATLTLLDAVRLMIILSDNTATNLVIDHLGSTHEERLKVVNDFLDTKGIKNTRLLNKIFSWVTKKRTPDAVRYGPGVASPEDMVTLSEMLYRGTLCDSASCETMLGIMKQLDDVEVVPRLLPATTCKSFDVAHKTGTVNGVRVDVGLVLSDRVTFAIAVFVDKHPDYREYVDNLGTLLGAHAARAVWNHFTGDTGYTTSVIQGEVDWSPIPGGSYALYRSSAAPFPHPNRVHGLRTEDGTFYPPFPHYLDSSIVVFVPEGFKETEKGANVIIHFHGWLNDNLNVLHHSEMFQTMVDQKINALLVLPQGPYFSRDSFGGKMEDEGGFRRLVQDVLATMKREGKVGTEKIGSIVVSAHSGGFRPAAFVLDKGGVSDHVTDVFLFDAMYSQQDKFKSWLLNHTGQLFGCYTEHLAKKCNGFEQEMKPRVGDRLQFTKTSVEHDDVVQAFFPQWLQHLGPEWKRTN